MHGSVHGSDDEGGLLMMCYTIWIGVGWGIGLVRLNLIIGGSWFGDGEVIDGLPVHETAKIAM